jgi:glycosyltransferase involved in cell wall biosynthesis
MKYPYVIFYRYENFSEIDKFFIENHEKLNCSLFFTSDKNDLNKLFDSNYQILVTYGNESDYIDNVNSIIANRIRNRWIHFNQIESIDNFNRSVNYCFIHNCSVNRESVRPIFSVFTPAYNSYHKIERAYNSLKNQTLKDWEFIIIDDSPDDNHFNFLRKLMINDSRVRLFRKAENNGNIGNLKNEAVSLCRGKYVLEFDHDDEILPNVLQDAVNCFENDNEIGFIYMDCIMLYENGNNFSYGDFISKGYGNYYCQKYNDKWVYVYNTPNINNITLSHLVCCPNHPRIWRKSALIEAGNYSEFLPICDDYEIILRTALNTKIAKICKFGYIQYLNDGNNNFSLIRNGEINRIGPQFIFPIFYDMLKINEHMKTLNAYEDEEYIYNAVKLWHRDDNYQHKYCNKTINLDYKYQYCIIGIDSLILNKQKINELYLDTQNDFMILDNKCDIYYLQRILDTYGFSRFKCYTLIDEPFDNLKKYFMMYKSCENYEFIYTSAKKLNYNTNYNNRHEVINYVSNPENKYLEIGVENGFTFNNVHFKNKIGVDPAPYIKNNNIVLKTSDEYFEECNEKFDIIFIDGMHQTEYVLNDLNNSISHINFNGKILIDDIIPLHYDEQLKIPIKKVYENNILKTLLPWTGDVWKVIYHILLNYRNFFDFEYFYNINYRGIAVIKIKENFSIPYDEIDIINNYSYHTDFENYLKLLQN